MEQTYKRTIPSRQADKPSTVQQNCLANSNAIYSITGSFAGLSANVKRLLGLGIKKPPTAKVEDQKQ